MSGLHFDLDPHWHANAHGPAKPAGLMSRAVAFLRRLRGGEPKPGRVVDIRHPAASVHERVVDETWR